MMAVLAGLLLVLASHFTAAAEPAPTLEDVNRALKSEKRVVLIGVPVDFFHPETLKGGSYDTMDDWSTYLNEWFKNSAKEKKIKIIVVQLDVLASALRTPAFNKKNSCATLFVKNRTEGLLYHENNCVLVEEQYEIGAKWLEGTASADELQQNDFKTTIVAARTGK